MDRGEIYDKIQYSVMDIRSPNEIIELYMHQSKAEWNKPILQVVITHYANRYYTERQHAKRHHLERYNA